MASLGRISIPCPLPLLHLQLENKIWISGTPPAVDTSDPARAGRRSCGQFGGSYSEIR